MEHNTFHKALEIQPELCIGCSHCIKVCPTEALRVSGGKATLYADWCIDCGRCFRVCPARAIRVVDDDLDSIFSYKYRVLLVPSVFYAQFEKKVPDDAVNRILGEMGFSEICAVEQSVDTLLDEVGAYVRSAREKPVISSFCPAVIRLIQVRFPSLIDHIMLLLPPIEVTAQYYVRRWQSGGGAPEDIGVFYLTPCIAKIAAVKSPVGGYESPINGVINMDYVYNKVLLSYKNGGGRQSGTEGPAVNDAMSSKGLRWPLTGGEASQVGGRSLAIDGMSNVIEFLEKLEDGEVEEHIDYLELRGCDESCAGGILVQGNRFLVADNLRSAASSAPDTHPLAGEYRRHCSASIKMEAVEPRSLVKYDKDINVAIKKMEMAGMLRKILPDIDCGACGAPSCEALAADIVRNDASLNNCIFMQARFEKEGSLQVSEAIDLMEKVWGKDRFVNNENTKSE
ncbi:MAG TPA: 4Fe-4S binding protein [Candidatus Coprenecus stercoravium]|uniref:4Fe-4S binding protein n=1 Tax=Candidatus Coprenecus stercoravium TaxID=2840735 RepID=A0A9D2KBJ3_9BACT|nr:4Fe-4S binding protein [Candidatus Coprenecus stercoravium]